jgi:phage terminase large subunit-like protein
MSTPKALPKTDRELNLIRVHRLQNERYRYYEPNGVGEQFINALKTDDYLICFISAANGVGKTAMASNIIANLCYPGNNPWFKGGVFDKWPYLKRGRIVTDSALVEKNVVNELKFWLPKNKYTTNKGGKHFESMWSTDTGWNWDIMTYDQEASQFEGVTLGWAWFDEPPPDAILKATIARMRRGGIIFITATPIGGSAHLYDLFASGKIETTVQLREGDEPQTVTRRIFHITADVESACKQHGVRGHLEHDHILQMVAEYPEDERQARVFGKFQHLIGLVYKMWNRNIHVIEPFELDPQDYCVYHALDPHPRNEDAGVWIAVDKKGRKYLVDEYYKNPETVKKLAWDIKNKHKMYRMEQPFLCDPSAFIEDQHTERCLATMLEEQGLHYIPASKARSASDARIKTALAFREQNGDLIIPPELYVFSNCVRFIYEVEHYRWAEWKGKIADERNRKEAPVDKDDHTIECVGRILFQEPQFREMVGRGSLGIITEEDLDPYAK